ncbi:MAG TPA: Hsp20/alpha crystallin family protein [Vicinamibacterales bacterium]|jgi:HSP20 family protein|nr:Hsp20/alpha crystallin family protein [Vicinamibacterales bacterium]
MLGLTRWNPFAEISALHRDLDRLFSRFFGDEARTPRETTDYAFVPAMDVYSTDQGWTVRLACPGIDPEKLEVNVAGNTLTVRGERVPAAAEGAPLVSEITYGRFERSIVLPEAIEPDKIQAVYRHGVLELNLPLKEAAKPRRIEIAVEEQKPLKAAA